MATTLTEANSSPSSEKSQRLKDGSAAPEDDHARSIGVRNLCEEKGLTLLTLAERSGIALERLKAIYLGRWTPSPQERQAIARVLDSPSGSIAWEHSTAVEHFYGPG